MKNKTNIEELIKKKLENHELPVRKDLWDSISSQLPAAASTSSSVIAKMSAIKWMVATVAVGILSTSIFLLTSEKKEQSHETPPQSTIAPTPTMDSSVVASKEDMQQESTILEIKASTSSTNLATNTTESQLENDMVSFKEPEVNDGSEVQISLEKNTVLIPEQNTSRERDQETEKESKLKIQATPLDKEAMRYLFFSNIPLAKSYAWYIDGEFHSNDSNFSYSFQEGKHNIALVVMDENNLTSTSNIELETYPPISYNLPNVFSPGSDRKNDVFDANLGIIHEKEILQLTITDKNGKIVFQSNERFIWDGRLPNGEIAPNAIYSYIILFVDKKNQPLSKGGIIQLFQE